LIKKIYHFSQSSPKGENEGVSGLLRRVASLIDDRKGAIVRDVVLNMAKKHPDDPNVSVYYTYPDDVEPPASDDRYEIKSIQIEHVIEDVTNGFTVLLAKAKEEIGQLGDIDVYDVTLDNIDGDEEKYVLTIYFD
jgi:hypothetical protein